MTCRSRSLCVLLSLVFLVIAPGVLSAETFSVAPDGKTGFPTIQAAIDVTRDGDIIVVQAGTYTGPGNRDIDLRGKAITVRSTEPENPDVVNATVIDCQADAKSPHRGFYVAGSNGAIISGLTITNGLAATGGAVYCENSDLTLTYCRILHNATLAGGAGGGVAAVASTLVLHGCDVSDNAAGAGTDSPLGIAEPGGDGGGVYATSSVVYVSGSTIADNAAGAGGSSDFVAGRGGHGGGIYADSLLVAQSTIARNAAGRGGSGMQGTDGGDGGGVYATRVTIDNGTIEGNLSGSGGDSTSGEKGIGGKGGDGGGVFCADSLQITGSLVAGNRCGSPGLGAPLAGMHATGGGLWCSQGVVSHCTIVANAAGESTSAGVDPRFWSSGGGLLCSGQASLTNSIAWGNTPDQVIGPDCRSVTYCDIQNGECPAEQGNVAADPAFVQPGHWANPGDPSVVVPAADPRAVWVSGNYRLNTGSPCVDAGDPGYAEDPNVTDLDGKARVAGAATDIGAYELQTLVPVYRFQSVRTGKRFYTADEAEKALLVQQSGTWIFEGVAYLTYAEPVEPGLVPVYRFWSEALSSHFWTISEAEKDLLIEKYADAWSYEGPVFYAYPEGAQPAEAKPVYRLWSGNLSAHFYTIDAAERDQMLADPAGGWVFEGIVWYAFEAPSSGGQPGGGTPQPQAGEYEFACERAAASYGLELKAYLDGREIRMDDPSVGLSSTAGHMKMAVDLGAMTTSLAQFHIQTDAVQHATVMTDSELTGAEFPLTLTLVGFFDTTTARGPFTIDPQTLTFPNAVGGPTAVGDEIFQIVGSAVLEGQKHEVNLLLAPTVFEPDGRATFDAAGYPVRLDVNMDGPCQWRRQGREDLLFQADLKGHVLQLYVASVHLRATGLWLGKSLSGEVKAEK